MKGGVRFYLAGSVMLLALAGCGRSLLQFGERASWRHDAEVACLKSGGVKIGAGVAQIQPIEGPGMCGADFPLKVAALGESSAVGYSDELRPPANVAGGSSEQVPRWPVKEPRYPAPVQPAQSQPIGGRPIAAPARYAPAIEPPEVTAPAGQPISLNPPGVAPLHDDIPDDAVLPPGRGAPPAYLRPQPASIAPVYQPPPQQRALPPLGPMRGPQTTATIMPAVVTPPATLACPIVSALDRWVSDGVQPAALRWFGAQVTEIKQISAYSCRSMVGAGTSHISEHAFGNALDIAGFTLADGRKVMVKDGWHGTPEEQGFLHDVQLFACETFTTVLAPGYNIYHYDHIHVDLMRRSSGRNPCRPNAIPGEVVAAKARAIYASKQRGPAYTGSVATQRAKFGAPPTAVPGEDGYVAEEDSEETVTGSIAASAKRHAMTGPGTNGDFDDEAITGSVGKPSAHPRSRPLSDDAIRASERKAAFH